MAFLHVGMHSGAGATESSGVTVCSGTVITAETAGSAVICAWRVPSSTMFVISWPRLARSASTASGVAVWVVSSTSPESISDGVSGVSMISEPKGGGGAGGGGLGGSGGIGGGVGSTDIMKNATDSSDARMARLVVGGTTSAIRIRDAGMLRTPARRSMKEDWVAKKSSTDVCNLRLVLTAF